MGHRASTQGSTVSLKHWIGAVLFFVAGAAAMAGGTDKPWQGRFEGTGRACSGVLSLDAGVLSWRWRYGACAGRRYTTLQGMREGNAAGLVARLSGSTSARCPYRVIEVEQADTYAWNVSGFPSLEAYENRDLPGWRDSPRPDRYVFSCLMTKVR